jgi:glycosyltransferase involved in cell wall biosynthesis
MKFASALLRRPVGLKTTLPESLSQVLGLIISKLFGLRDRVIIFFGRRHWVDNDVVSIPIATYDRWLILKERTLPSLFAQDHPNLEIVIVADGSPRDDFSLAEKEITDPRVRLFRLKKRSRYPASRLERWMVAGSPPRNVAARKSSGSWIYWISDDDVLLPNAVSTLLAEARRSGVESVHAGYVSGTTSAKLMVPSVGAEELGVAFSGPKAWLVKNYVGRMWWNKWSWMKPDFRPVDYDLLERMLVAGVTRASIDAAVAIQPEVDGTPYPGRLGALYSEGDD